MIRSILLALILVGTPALAQAQEGSPGAEHKWSVGTGIGFAASIGPEPFTQSGFNWQLDGQYRVTDSISAGVFMQVAPVTGGSLFSMSGQGLYHFGFFQGQSNDFLSNVVPYAGLGMGFTHFGVDRIFGGGSDNAFLFQMIFGAEYNINEHIALTSDMRFNIIGGSIANEHFYYSWQIIGARYRF